MVDSSQHALFDGPQVTLMEVLDQREARAQAHRRLLEARPGASLVSVTLNLPGPVKTSPGLQALFDRELVVLEEHLEVITSEVLHAKTGNEAYYVCRKPALDLKRDLLALEAERPTGRLFDYDVLVLDQGQVQPISRQDLGLAPQTCLLCSEPAKACARNRTHTLEELYQAIINLIDS